MERLSGEALRIIDANLDRAGEGLRVLEDLARLALNDTSLSQRFKDLRHELVHVEPGLQQRLLEARDSGRDVGIDLEAPGQDRARDLAGSAIANSRRVQEALRVLEETSRLAQSGLNPEPFKHARFSLYTLEKGLVSALLRRDKAGKIRGLYVIIDTQSLKGISHAGAAEKAIRGGARIIQLRDKTGDRRAQLRIARELKEICARNNALFIVNDHLDLALASRADGVHLGQDDFPLLVARELMPLDGIIGVSVSNVEQALAARAGGADYVAVSAIYPTYSKEQEVVGLEMLRAVRQAVDSSLVALGGINQENIRDVLAAGADSVAVISAVLGAPDIEQASRDLVKECERIKNER